MNYVDEIMEALAYMMPDCDIPLLRLYALLVLVKGEQTSLEDVHDAWALWRNTNNPLHPSLVRFQKLTPEIQELDRPYMDTIHAVAKVYNPSQAEGLDG